MSREERLRLRFQAMARDLDDETDLDELDALRLIHFMGKDFKDRTVVYLSGANLMVRPLLADICAFTGWNHTSVTCLVFWLWRILDSGADVLDVLCSARRRWTTAACFGTC
jgi:hypothetical protein